MKVLVVEDQLSVRQIIKNGLGNIGYKDIHEALNGEEGLAKLKAGGFGLVIADWNMPVMTGIELLRAVRANPTLKSIPFLMVTAERLQENIIEAIQAGVSGYLVKPFSEDNLREKLEKVFEKKST
ncbi:MAG: response regulator [Nitrospirae bacterium]|nr:response regulator [Nitrospirota bacterium]